MKRISTTTRSLNKFGAGKDGFTNGNVVGGIPSTDLEDTWFDNVQEEIANVVESTGVALSGADQTQLLVAIRKMAVGRLLRRLVYARVGGVQMVSINGAAFTATGAGTYIPGSGANFVILKVQGAGSGGAGATAPAGGLVSLGAPGSSGSYGESYFPIATVGASQVVTVGLGSAGNSGLVGGTSSVGALTTAPGGTAAGGLASQSPPTLNGNGTPAAAATGANLFSIAGASPNLTIAQSATVGSGGSGGASIFGPGGNGPAMNTNGVAGVNPGSGGSGSLVNSGGGTSTSGAGAPGIVIIEEY